MQKEDKSDINSANEPQNQLKPDPECIYCEGTGSCFCGPCPCVQLPEENENA